MCNILALVLHRDKIISVSFMKKYIHIAKCMKPTLTEEASEAIAEEYSRLRSQDTVDTDIARVRIREEPSLI
jgi:DNA replication licensing factor MCM3